MLLQFLHPGLNTPEDLNAAFLPYPRIFILDLRKFLTTPFLPSLLQHQNICCWADCRSWLWPKSSQGKLCKRMTQSLLILTILAMTVPYSAKPSFQVLLDSLFPWSYYLQLMAGKCWLLLAAQAEWLDEQHRLDEKTEELGVGQRKRRENVLYQAMTFWLHWWINYIDNLCSIWNMMSTACWGDFCKI